MLRDFFTLAARRQGELSPLRQFVELVILYLWRGVGPGYYQTAGFWRRGLPWRSKTSHLSAREYRSVLEALNPPAYRKLSQHKVVEKAVLRLFNVPSSRYLGFYCPLNGASVDGSPLRTPDELGDFLGGMPEGSRVCFKPLEGWGGNGIVAARITQSDGGPVIERNGTGEVMDAAGFCRSVIEMSQGRACVIESFLDQHPAMARFNPSSVNTLRIWVARREDLPPRVILGYLRIGRQGSPVDNQSSGGIVAPFDLQSGVLSKAIDGLPGRETFAVHPDHGAQIEGEHLPFFRESLDLATRCLLPFAPIRFAGADIAITEQGPCVIELNVCPDREGAAFTDTPSRQLIDYC